MAEAIVKLRSLYLSGDFDDYWPFHVAQDQLRLHPPRLWSVVANRHTPPQFVTPTPYSPTEVISWLALPTTARREFALFLNATQLSDVRGPRRVLLGGGLEYILASGFPATAIVVGWPVPVV